MGIGVPASLRSDRRFHCCDSQTDGIIKGMHAEAVKVGARPSEIGLMHDARSALNCEECDARYYLHYDGDAEGSLTYWRVLAQEIITARHPHHRDNVVLHRLEKF